MKVIAEYIIFIECESGDIAAEELLSEDAIQDLVKESMPADAWETAKGLSIMVTRV